ILAELNEERGGGVLAIDVVPERTESTGLGAQRERAAGERKLLRDLEAERRCILRLAEILNAAVGLLNRVDALRQARRIAFENDLWQQPGIEGIIAGPSGVADAARDLRRRALILSHRDRVFERQRLLSDDRRCDDDERGGEEGDAHMPTC